MKLGLMGKVFAVLGVVLLLMMGVGEIRGVLAERQRFSDEALRSIEQSHAGRQTLLGPAITMACSEEWPFVTGEGKKRIVTKERREFIVQSAPKTLTLDGRVDIEPRTRGLFKVNTYSLKSTVNASWSAIETMPTREKGVVQCAAPTLFVAVTDARGLRTVKAEIAGEQRTILPGTEHAKFTRGFHIKLSEIEGKVRPALDVKIVLDLVGIESLSVVPLGDDTKMSLAGNWPHPSFAGKFLPAEKPKVSEQGFTASWRISSLSSTAQRDFIADTPTDKQSSLDRLEAFEVAFINPVNPYSLGDRATKYALLFIALTFAAVGLFEIMKKLRVHPVQYFLTGSALAIFFLLLLSLSEHLDFNYAYAIAASACVALLTFYASYMLQGFKRGLPFGAAAASLYGALFILLQLEQAALVVGSGLLFAVLALVMFVTRKLDWYAMFGSTLDTFNGLKKSAEESLKNPSGPIMPRPKAEPN